jgi:TP901 family phage tail tape measure protein
MANLLGTVSGQIKIDVSQALAAYIAVQKANRDTTNALRQISGTLNTVGNAIGVVGIGLAGALGYAAKQAADFNAQMSYFQAISGSTANDMDAIRQKALQLDQTTMFSTKDIANMFVELAKAGESAKQITGGVADAVVNLAQAAQIPLNSAVSTVVSVMNAYDLSLSQASDVSDRLAGAANASILEVSDLATSLKYVAGVAHELGISFDETTTALDLLGQAGIKGSMGGTELRQIMVSILGTTKPAAAELQKLGIITKNGANQFFDASGKAKSLSDIFQILQDHLKGLNQEQQLAALKTIFNNRALSAAAILTKEGAAGFKQMNEAMSGTTAADVAAERMDNLQGDVKKLTSSLQTMAIQAGQPLQNFLRQVVQGLTALVHWFQNLSPATQANIIHLLAIAAALLIAASALIKIVGFAVKLWETFGRLAQAAKFLWSVIAAVGEGIIDLGAAILASPIGIIIAAVVLLGVVFYLLYEKVKPVRDFFNAIGRGLRTAFEATVR